MSAIKLLRLGPGMIKYLGVSEKALYFVIGCILDTNLPQW